LANSPNKKKECGCDHDDEAIIVFVHLGISENNDRRCLFIFMGIEALESIYRNSPSYKNPNQNPLKI